MEQKTKRKKLNLLPENKRGEGNYTPLFASLIILFIVALTLNLILASFDIDASVPNPESSLGVSDFYNNLVDKVNSADSFFISGMIGFVIEQINVWTYVPSEIAIPFFILFFISIVWSAIKLFLP